MSKSDVYDMINKRVAKNKKLSENSGEGVTVRQHIMDFLNWADKLSGEIKNKDALKQSIAGRLHLLEARLRAVDWGIRYDIEFNEENGTLEAINIRYSHRARTADPALPEHQTFRMEDFLLEQMGIL